GAAFKQIVSGPSYYGAEVFALGFNNNVYTLTQNGPGWTALTNLGGNAKSISPTSSFQTAYVIDATNHAAVDRYVNLGSGSNPHWTWTGFQQQSTQGFTEVTAELGHVYGLGADNHVYEINPTGMNVDVGDYTPSMTIDPGSFTSAINPD